MAATEGARSPLYGADVAAALQTRMAVYEQQGGRLKERRARAQAWAAQMPATDYAAIVEGIRKS